MLPAYASVSSVLLGRLESANELYHVGRDFTNREVSSDNSFENSRLSGD